MHMIYIILELGAHIVDLEGKKRLAMSTYINKMIKLPMIFCLVIPMSFLLPLPLPLLPLPIVLTLCLMIPTILLTGGKNAEKTLLRKMDIG